MTKANNTLSFDDFAKQVGQFGKQLKDAAKPLADAYASADKAQQADLKARWMLNHLIGQGFTNAKDIIKVGKGKGAKREHVQAIDRAYSDFRYNIVTQGKKKPASSASREQVVAPRKVFNSVLAEIINSGMTKAEFNALIAELRDSVDFQ